MINENELKNGYGRKWMLPDFIYYPWHLPDGGAEENHKTSVRVAAVT
jgi:hypothetical protein